MIESIKFDNFKALRDTTLPLSWFTLIVGANGSGKSSALTSFLALQAPYHFEPSRIRSASTPRSVAITLTAKWKEDRNDNIVTVSWEGGGVSGPSLSFDIANQSQRASGPLKVIARARLFSLDANAIASPVALQPSMDLAGNGANLAGVLDRLRDLNPERFEVLNEQLGRWIPEFNRILFETPSAGERALALRTRKGGHVIKAADLSHGTLIALALLTLAYLPEPPSIVCLEEPDHGLHPRLLRDVRDALYLLAYPEGSRETRPPVQVIATTHNPYFLDLFREHPDEIVIAEKIGLDARFSRLSDRADLEEILGDAPLSEVWYSGILGGVPAGT
jgi:predicted ATPase